MGATVASRQNEAGVSLIETLVAMALLLVSMAGLGSLGIVGLTTTENQGHLAARTTEYAQDKMEQLLVLAYGDTSSDTRVFPASASGGTGLAIGGSADPAAPVVGYVDYLDQNGNLLVSGNAAPAGWFYERVWVISTPSANLKQISVTATVASSLGRQQRPSATVTVLKTFPF
ncbi:MAG: prepilin-type N-terminal cleavage/methylation domain-containing protein [Acidobacteriota bacterium]